MYICMYTLLRKTRITMLYFMQSYACNTLFNQDTLYIAYVIQNELGTLATTLSSLSLIESAISMALFEIKSGANVLINALSTSPLDVFSFTSDITSSSTL